MDLPLLILADDLTGAADCAARCADAGLTASVYLRPPQQPPGTMALALTSDSRHLPAAAAAERVRWLLRSLQPGSASLWYKKIDSTLRGNIGSELDAMLDTLPYRHALVCPAFPAQRRGLLAGSLVYDGASAPVHLPTLLEQQSRRAVTSIALDDVRAGARQLARRLAAAEAPLIVVDGTSERDLRTLVRAAALTLPDTLFCGSAGLIGALTREHPALRQPAPRRPETQTGAAPPGPALVVVGSGSAMARRQIGYLQQHARLQVLTLDAGAELPGNSDVLLHLPPPPPGSSLDGPEARALAAALAGRAQAIVEQHRPALLVLAGGDTALHVLQRLGIERLDVLRELLPGMPLALGHNRAGRQQLVVLKAGNHGDERALATLLALARAPSERKDDHHGRA